MIPILLLACAALVAVLLFQMASVRRLRREVEDRKEDISRNAKLLIEKTLELNDKNLRLEKWLQSQADFTAIVTHQLRTPLTAAKWSLESVLSGDKSRLSEDQISNLEGAMSATSKMILLVNDLLHMIKIEAGTDSFSLAPMQPDAFLRGIVMAYQHLARRKNIRLDAEFAGGQATITVDSEMFEMVVTNLIENAIAYSPEGGRIVCRTKAESERFLVEVEDEGIGMSEEQQEMIFQRFYRSPEARRMRPEGSGLGLYLSRNIAQNLGGQLGFEPGRAKGSKFYLELPVHNPSAAQTK